MNNASDIERIAREYTPLVKAAAAKYQGRGAEYEDLVQEGMIGLNAAITDYRPGGSSFKNFAYLCIARRIRSAIRSAARKKHLPLKNYVPLLNADGQGKNFPDRSVCDRVRALNGPIRLTTYVSLTCTNCPARAFLAIRGASTSSKVTLGFSTFLRTIFTIVFNLFFSITICGTVSRHGRFRHFYDCPV